MNPAQLANQIVFALNPQNLVWNGKVGSLAAPSGAFATVLSNAGGVGLVTAGNHTCAVTYVYGNGSQAQETAIGQVSNTVNFPGATQASLQIFLPPPGVTAVNVYMTKAGGATYYFVEQVLPSAWGSFTGYQTFAFSISDATLNGNANPPPVSPYVQIPGEPVLSRVLVDPDVPGVNHQDLVLPAALVHVETDRDDPENPADLIEEQRFTLSVYAANASEQSGSSAIVGGNREDLGSSRGRGILEIEPLVRAQLFNTLGLTARLRVVGGQPTAYAGKMNGVIAGRSLDLVATRIPALPDYAKIQRLKGVGGGGNVTLSWAAPPARYDLIGYTWVRVSGSTPAPTPAGGTFVASLTPTLADSPGAGTWAYSIFWAFDSTVDPFTGTGVVPAAPNAWSSQQSSQAGLVYLPAQITVVA